MSDFERKIKKRLDEVQKKAISDVDAKIKRSLAPILSKTFHCDLCNSSAQPTYHEKERTVTVPEAACDHIKEEVQAAVRHAWNRS